MINALIGMVASGLANSTPEIIGVVANDNFIQSNWITKGSGTTWTYNPNSINSVGTAGAFTSIIRYNAWFSMTESFRLTAIHTMNVKDANQVFLMPGIEAKSEFSSGFGIYAGVWSNIANSGTCYLYVIAGALVAQSANGALTLSAGNQIRTIITVSNNGQTITATFQNYTTLGNIVTLTYTNLNNFVYGGTNNLPNIFQPAFANYRGDYTINSWTYEVNDYNNIDLLLIGDSKTEGYYGGTYPNTIGGLWKANNPTKKIQVEAASGNVTQDILNCMPEILLIKPTKSILFIGRNDVSNGVLNATWQANYISIVNQLQSIGCVVYHQVHTAEAAGGTGYDVLINWVIANYPAENVITQPATWNGATDNAADGVHPNTTGSLKIYNKQASIVIL